MQRSRTIRQEAKEADQTRKLGFGVEGKNSTWITRMASSGTVASCPFMRSSNLQHN